MAGKELKGGKKTREVFGGKKMAGMGKFFWREYGISPLVYHLFLVMSSLGVFREAR